ncbi:hypothetical protein [Dactylosporangium sp. CA-233914]|uniref:hypothetical protein n=1 Tax=Dactylosporangium sp. CA-233914 TaxID=3239934 RepID=UPI003D8A97BF
MNRPYSVTLTCRAAAHRVGRHLTAVHTAAARHARIASRLVITNDHHTLAEAARSATDLLIMDGHGYNHPEPRIGMLPLAGLRSPTTGLRAAGVVLGCCDGATEPFPAALRAALDRPAAVLACTGRADYDDAEMLYPTVLDTLQTIAPADVAPSAMAEILELALNTVAARWPGHNWRRWSVLPPAEACRPVAWTRR